MARREEIERVDPALISRVATLSPGGQRWLKTAIQAIRSIPLLAEEEETPQLPAAKPRAPRRREPAPPPPGLEDVITGKADLKDLDAYPELSEELEGLGEIIDMLRGLGESRRRRGEQILREEILGRSPEREPVEDDEDFSF
jgi:hypothetical protein